MLDQVGPVEPGHAKVQELATEVVEQQSAFQVQSLDVTKRCSVVSEFGFETERSKSQQCLHNRSVLPTSSVLAASYFDCVFLLSL